MPNVVRVTMFKIPSQETIQKLMGLYRTLSSTAKKDNKPYILSLAAGPANADERSQGFTFIAKTEFKSREDFEFYDKECEAHGVLKKELRSWGSGGEGVQGMMMVWYEPQIEAKI